jgi:hypothetical protein
MTVLYVLQNNVEILKPKTHQGRTVSKTVRRCGFIYRREFGEKLFRTQAGLNPQWSCQPALVQHFFKTQLSNSQPHSNTSNFLHFSNQLFLY